MREEEAVEPLGREKEEKKTISPQRGEGLCRAWKEGGKWPFQRSKGKRFGEMGLCMVSENTPWRKKVRGRTTCQSEKGGGGLAPYKNPKKKLEPPNTEP